MHRGSPLRGGTKVALRELEHLGHLDADFAFGDIVDELCNDTCALFHLVHAHFEACHCVAFGAYNFVELEFGIDGVGIGFADVACPA